MNEAALSFFGNELSKLGHFRKQNRLVFIRNKKAYFSLGKITIACPWHNSRLELDPPRN